MLVNTNEQVLVRDLCSDGRGLRLGCLHREIELSIVIFWFGQICGRQKLPNQIQAA